MNDKWYNSTFAELLSVGLMIFLICVGIGTCCKIAKFPRDEIQNVKQGDKTLHNNIEHERKH
jgi:hypothetical protein